MKTNKIRISDIANALGTSTVSISRALSGQPGVGEDLKNRIIQKAEEMGYKKSKKEDPLKVLVLHQKPYIHDNSNFSYMVQGIEKHLQNADIDYHTEYIDKESQDGLRLPYKLSKSARFDGVILMGRFNISYANFIHTKIKNLIFFTGYSPAYDYDSVWFSFINAGYKQCEYLIKKGHKNIGFLGSKNFYRGKEKILGICSALEDNSIIPRQEYFLNMEQAYKEHVLKLISQKNLPTAFICDYDFSALELTKLLHENGLKVPQDVSIMGSGNTEMSLLSIPALTTLDLNIDYACQVVISTLLKRISKPEKPYENVAILSRLIERDSVINRS